MFEPEVIIKSKELEKMFIDYYAHLNSTYTKYYLKDILIGIGVKNKAMIVMWIKGIECVTQVFDDNSIDSLSRSLEVTRKNICELYEIDQNTQLVKK